MTEPLDTDQAQAILKEVEGMLDNEATAARLSFHTHHRLERIRRFLQDWISSADLASQEQQGQMMADLLESLAQDEASLAKRDLN